jgi:hypothetical protein
MDYMPKVVVAVNPGADSERRFDGLTMTCAQLTVNVSGGDYRLDLNDFILDANTVDH